MQWYPTAGASVPGRPHVEVVPGPDRLHAKARAPHHLYDRVLAHEVTRAEREEERGTGVVEQQF